MAVRETFSSDAKTVVRHLASVVKPVIYTLRKRQLRVVFIELHLRKSLQEAEEFDRRMIGSRNNTVRHQIEQESEGLEQRAESENVSHPGDIHDDNREVTTK